MAGTTYQELLDGVAQYYGSGSDQWVSIARYGVNAETIPIIEQVPGVSITRSNSGTFLGFDYNNPFAGTGNPASIIDSNVQTGAYGQGAFNAQLPATAVTNPSTGLVTMESGARATSTGLTVATVADKVSLALAGVALGTKLGKLIDAGIYSTNPNWFDEHFPYINPETWDDIATTQAGKSVIRSIFGLKDDSATMYIDERLLAYNYMMLLQAGAYAPVAPSHTIAPEIYNTLPYKDNFSLPIIGSNVAVGYRYAYFKFEVITSTSPVYECCVGRTATDTGEMDKGIIQCSLNPFTLKRYTSNDGTTWSEAGNYPASTKTLLGNTFYIVDNLDFFRSVTGDVNIITNNFAVDSIAYVILYGDTITPATVPGISDNPQASILVDPDALINPTTGQPVTPSDDPADVLQALKNQYPDLFNDSIYEDAPQDDGTVKRISYIPVPYPNTTNINQPITQVTPNVNPQVTPQVTPDTYPSTITQQLTDSLTGTPTPPDTGGGETPPAVIPTGSTSALYSIYNPSQGELNSFGAWLWSSNFVDQLLKLFNDPMQAIIGLHKVFAQPAISGTSTIKVGYLDSGVPSNVVGNQYTTIDCGTVDVSEYFGNVFDYDPFTQIYIYLPFVGIEKLDTGDVMRGRVGVKYHVDVLTGACLAEITITRDGAGGIIYTFAGNCAVQYPISSGSYMGIVASLASIAGGVVGTVASGGAIAPVAMGAVGGIMNAHTRVNHSGAFSGNAGAMGVKIPYLIITRPQTCLADDFPAFDGYPANKATTISACSGFVKCETCHVENVPATDAELSEIEMLLKSGVII